MRKSASLPTLPTIFEIVENEEPDRASCQAFGQAGIESVDTSFILNVNICSPQLETRRSKESKRPGALTIFREEDVPSDTDCPEAPKAKSRPQGLSLLPDSPTPQTPSMLNYVPHAPTVSKPSSTKFHGRKARHFGQLLTISPTTGSEPQSSAMAMDLGGEEDVDSPVRGRFGGTTASSLQEALMLSPRVKWTQAVDKPDFQDSDSKGIMMTLSPYPKLKRGAGHRRSIKQEDFLFLPLIPSAAASAGVSQSAAQGPLMWRLEMPRGADQTVRGVF